MCQEVDQNYKYTINNDIISTTDDRAGGGMHDNKDKNYEEWGQLTTR